MEKVEGQIGKVINLSKKIKVMGTVVVLLGLMLVSNHIIKDRRDKQYKEEFLANHKDNLVYWDKNPIYFMKIEEQDMSELKIGIGKKTYNGGTTFYKREFNDYNYELDYFTYNILEGPMNETPFFNSEVSYIGVLNREVCEEYGIDYDNFYSTSDGTYFVERDMIIWDEYLLSVGEELMGHIGYIYNFNREEVDILKPNEYDFACDGVSGARAYNKAQYFYRDSKLYTFYKDKNGIFLRIFISKE